MFRRAARGWRLFGHRFAEASLARKAYVLFKLVVGPSGILLVVIGLSSDQDALAIVGLVIGGLYLIDTALVFPFIMARRDMRGGRRK